MKKKQLKLCALSLLVFGLTGLKAQTVYVKEISGTQTAYSLNNISQISFSQGNITISKSSGSPDTYAMLNLRCISFTDLGTGISKGLKAVSGIRLFPNPVNDILNIQLSSTGNSTTIIEILSIEGKVVYTQSINSNTNVCRINIQCLPNGLYVCKQNNGAAIETTKFIKQ